MDSIDFNCKDYAPLVLFVYNRADHAKMCLDAINCNEGAGKTDIYIFSDGAKNAEDQKKVDDVRLVLEEFKINNNFRKVKISTSTSNKGLANSVISGVTEIIDIYGKVIALEDDLITSKDYLNYMNLALIYYEREEKIWSIAGYTPDLKSLRKYNEDVWFCDRAGSWGWATWKNRWDTIDWSVSDYSDFLSDKKRINAFKQRGYNMPELLDKQMHGQIDSWAIRFCYEQFKQKKVTVNPTLSRVYNAGFDGTGTHGEIHRKWKVNLYEGDGNIKFIKYRKNNKISRDYYYYQAQYPLIRVMRTAWKYLKEKFGIRIKVGIFD